MRKFNKKIIHFEVGGVDIIGNLNNGSYCGLSTQGKKIVEKIEQGEPLSVSEKFRNAELIRFFEKSGFFTESNKTPILSAYLHVTNKCNLTCVGCYSEDATRNTNSDLDFSQMMIVLQKLKKMGIEILVISGGEPLIREDLYDILKYAKNTIGIKYIVVLSNGLLLTEDKAKKLSTVVDEYSISIDCYNDTCPSYIRGNNRFKDLAHSIKLAKQFFRAVNILPTLHRNNIDDTEEYIKLAKQFDVNISFSILTCGQDAITDSLIPTRSQLESLGKNFVPGEQLVIPSKSINDFSMTACEKCGIGEEIISIASNGMVYPCHMCHVEMLSLGNISIDSIDEILLNRNKMLHDVKVDNIEDCKACKYRYLCGGGCRARAYLNTNSFYKADPYCVMFKTYAQIFEQALIDNYGK